MGPRCLRAGLLMEKQRSGLSEGEQVFLEEHLRGCASCRSDQRGIATLASDYRAALDRAADPGVRERALRRALDAPPAPHRATSFRLGLAVLLGTCAAGVAAMLFFVGRDGDDATVASKPVVRQGDRLVSGDLEVDGQVKAAGSGIAPATVLSTQQGALLTLGPARVGLDGGTRITWLPDASTVVVRAGRVEVELDAARAHPFKVATDRFVAEVVGTAFSVDVEQVRVSRGRVRIMAWDGATLVTALDAGQVWSVRQGVRVSTQPPPRDGATPDAIALAAPDETTACAPGNSDRRVPVTPPPYGVSATQWWAAHPFNPDLPGHVPVGGICSPEPTIDVFARHGGDLPAALAALPSGGGTLYLQPGTYDGRFTLAGKSHVHFVSPGGAVLVGGPARIAGCSRALDERSFTPCVRAQEPACTACVTSGRVSDIYFKNITFDGQGTAATAVELAAVNGVVFDGCTFENYVANDRKQPGVISGLMRPSNVWIRGSRIAASQRWGVYLNGLHGGGVVSSHLEGFSEGAILFKTHVSLIGDHDGDGRIADDEMTQSSYVVAARNTLGAPAPATRNSTGISISGANSIVEKNEFTRKLSVMTRLMGECDVTNPRVAMTSFDHVVRANRAAEAVVFVKADGTPHNCHVRGNARFFGRYRVEGNVISRRSPTLVLVEESYPAGIDGPNIIQGNVCATEPCDGLLRRRR